MISEIINNVIEEITINEFDKALLVKAKYNFKLSSQDLFMLSILGFKIKMLRSIYESKKC